MIFIIICLTSLNSSPQLSYLDSLFIRASVGRIDYLELNEPARDSLANYPEDTIGQYLINKFSNCSAREFHSLVDIFKKMETRGRPSLIEGLHSENLDIKLASIYTAGEIKDTFLILQCLSLVNDTNVQVRANLARVLYILNDSLALINLIKLANDSASTVKLYALISLSKIDLSLDQSLPGIISSLDDSNVTIRSAMSEIISKLNDSGIDLIIRKFPNLAAVSKLAVISGLALNPNQTAQNFIFSNFEDFDLYQRAAAYQSWYNLYQSENTDSANLISPSWDLLLRQEPYLPLKNYLQYIIEQETM